jgi:serine-type D-Ala-D-Ala carboxypeptidase/endopeptidase (penicillin-binding protein 4)
MKAGRGRPCTDLARKIAELLEEPSVARAHWGIDVVGMDGAPIFSLNEGQLFQPASNAKLFTTAAAMALLGGNSTFNTRIYAEGSVVAGRLQGNLVMRGDGDANISGRSIPYVSPSLRSKPAAPALETLHILDTLADQIAATGLKVIDGDVVGNDTLFPWEPYPEDWSIDDMVWGYGVPVSALSINDNQLKLTIAPGVLPKMTSARGAEGPTPAVVTVEPQTAYYTIDNTAVTIEAKSKGSIGIDRAPGSRTLRIYGTIAEDALPEVEEIAIDDPAEYAAKSLKERLETRGIVVKGKAVAQHRLVTEPRDFMEQLKRPIPDLDRVGQAGVVPCLRCGVSNYYAGDRELAVHQSVTVAEDVVVTNKVSQNLHAELLLHQLGVAFSDDQDGGSTAQGARVVRQFLLNSGIDKDDFVFFDGSGLSGHDLVTPRATVRLLQFASTQPWFADWKRSLPVGGEDGSLMERFSKPPLAGHVFAKTGTLGEARALSGYLDCASGRTVIFSIMVGNHMPQTSKDRDVMDKIVAAIAATN